MAREVIALARLVECAEARIPLGPSASCTSVVRDGPRGGNDPSKAASDRADEYDRWYQRSHAELVMLAEDVETIIGGLETWCKIVIRSYYIDAKTDSEVAALMGWKCHQRAQEKRMEIVKNLD